MSHYVGAGELRTLAELQRKSIGITSAGGRDVTWVRERDIWCRIQGLSASMRLEAMAREPRITHEIIVRQEEDIDPTKRIVVTGPLANDLLTGLGAYWKMEEPGSSTRLDSIGNADLTDFGGVGRVAGLIDNCADFPGSDSLIFSGAVASDVFDIEDDEPWTIALWINLDTVIAGKGIFSRGGEVAVVAPLQLTVGNNGGNANFQIAVRNAADTAHHSVFATSFGIPSTGSWVRIVAWRDVDADTLNIQVNDGNVDSVSLAGGGVSCDPTKSVSFGIVNGGSHINAQIDEVGWWRAVLSAADRTSHYGAGSGLALDQYGVAFNPRVFTIVGEPEDIDERKRFVRLLAAEGVAS